MKTRTALLFVMLLLIGTTATEAQPAEKVRVIGYLGPGGGPGLSAVILGQGLRDLGWIDGKNVRIEYRWADNKPERLAPLAEELVRLNVELIVASSTPAVQAARNATTTIPIVMGPAADAEGSGFVASLARPGGNITGVSMMMPALSGKRLELLHEIMPRLSRIAYLAYANTPDHKMFLQQTQMQKRAYSSRRHSSSSQISFVVRAVASRHRLTISRATGLRWKRPRHQPCSQFRSSVRTKLFAVVCGTLSSVPGLMRSSSRPRSMITRLGFVLTRSSRM